MSTEAFAISVIQPNGASDVAMSHDQSLLYVALSSGTIRVIEIATGAEIAEWSYGVDLNSISLSEDGSFLLAAGYNSIGGQPVIYKIDTETGVSQTFISPQPSSWGFYDVEIIDDDTALLTSGDWYVTSFDIPSGSFADFTALNDGNRDVLVQDGDHVLLMNTNSSNAEITVYNRQTGTVRATVMSGAAENGGYNFGSQAISEAAGLIVRFMDRGLDIYDLSLNFVRSVEVGELIDGLAFDPSGQFAYAYLIQSGVVAKFDTTTWAVVEEFETGTSQWHNHIGFGGQIRVTDSGRYISVMDTNASSGKLQLIDVTGRDETLSIGPGVRTMEGGAGIDTLVVNFSNATQPVTMRDDQGVAGAPAEDSDGGYAGSLGDGGSNRVDFASIEIFDLTTGSGNDYLRTGSGNDRLNGGSGADDMAGGAGNDTYVVDNAGDVVSELLDEGVDTVETTRGTAIGVQQQRLNAYQLGANVENLTATGLGQGLRGNGLDNVIIGSAGADYIDASDGGRDTVIAGDGRDVIYYGGAFDGDTGPSFPAGDANDGGGADGDIRGDLLVLQGSYTNLHLGDYSLVGIEKLRLLKATNTSFGYTEGGAFQYWVYTVDANVDAGGRLVVQGGSLQAGEDILFWGREETDGSFQVFGGRAGDMILGGQQGDHLLGRAGDDSLFGEGGDDRLRGGLGSDRLEGDAGADTYVYAAQGGDEPYSVAALESTSLKYDMMELNPLEDKIDLPQTVTSLASVNSGILNDANFDADIAAAVDATLAAYGAVLFTPNGGEHMGDAFLVVDGDGNGVYQANLDYVIGLGPTWNSPPIGIEIFI
jgi:hypothetical protein